MMQVSLPSNRGTDAGSVAESNEATVTACNACLVLTESDQEMLAMKACITRRNDCKDSFVAASSSLKGKHCCYRGTMQYHQQYMS